MKMIDSILVMSRSAVLALFAYSIVLLVGIVIGLIMSSIPFIASAIFVYTNIPLTAIVPLLMIFVKIIKD